MRAADVRRAQSWSCSAAAFRAGHGKQPRRYLHLEFYTACGSWTQLREMMGQFVQVYSALLERVGNSGATAWSRASSAIPCRSAQRLAFAGGGHAEHRPSYISMIFKGKNRTELQKDYLFQTQMNHASACSGRGMAIGEIARQLGYEDTEHFSRRFRAQLASPMAYRKEGAPAGRARLSRCRREKRRAAMGWEAPPSGRAGRGLRGPRSSPGGGETRFIAGGLPAATPQPGARRLPRHRARYVDCPSNSLGVVQKVCTCKPGFLIFCTRKRAASQPMSNMSTSTAVRRGMSSWEKG